MFRRIGLTVPKRDIKFIGHQCASKRTHTTRMAENHESFCSELVFFGGNQFCVMWESILCLKLGTNDLKTVEMRKIGPTKKDQRIFIQLV